MYKSEFVWSDSWLLTSLYLIGLDRVDDLSSIIACGDYLNHAIFTFEEFDIGMAHLTKAQLVKYYNGIVELTEKSLDLRNNLINNKRVNAKEVFKQVGKYLDVSYQDKLTFRTDYKLEKVVSRDDFEKAVNKYQTRGKETITPKPII